jgi:hypothetical protein
VHAARRQAGDHVEVVHSFLAEKAQGTQEQDLDVVAFGAVAVTYGVTALQRGSLLGEVVALVAAYVALYVALGLMPTFAELARGADPVEALRNGLGWLVRHPTPALAMGLVTVAVLALTVLLTIAFVVAFAGVAFSVQLTVIDAVEERSPRGSAAAVVADATDT